MNIYIYIIYTYNIYIYIYNIYLSIYSFNYLFVYLFVCLFVCEFVCTYRHGAFSCLDFLEGTHKKWGVHYYQHPLAIFSKQQRIQVDIDQQTVGL